MGRLDDLSQFASIWLLDSRYLILDGRHTASQNRTSSIERFATRNSQRVLLYHSRA